MCRSLTYASIFLKTDVSLKFKMTAILIVIMYAQKLVEASRNVSYFLRLERGTQWRINEVTTYFQVILHHRSSSHCPIVVMLSQLRKARPLPIRSQKKMFTFHCLFKVSSFGPVEKMDLHKHICGKTTCVLGGWYQGQKQNFNPLSKNKRCLRSLLLLLFVLSAQPAVLNKIIGKSS